MLQSGGRSGAAGAAEEVQFSRLLDRVREIGDLWTPPMKQPNSLAKLLRSGTD